jgi:hypothetical protein
MIPGPPGGEDRRLERELRAVAAERSRGLGEHPSPDELVDYHFGSLPAEEVDRLQDHLAFCRECSQVVLDMAAFSAGEPEQPAADLDREWDRLETRLEREGGGRRRRPAWNQGFVWALAASVLATLGLFGWNLDLRRDLAESRRPRADVGLVDLAPEAKGTARAIEAPARVRVRQGQGWVLLLLNLGDLREFPGYRMELVDPGKGVIWGRSRVPRGEDGAFLLEIPAQMLESKVYRVRLYGERGKERTAVASYSFEVARGPAEKR